MPHGLVSGSPSQPGYGSWSTHGGDLALVYILLARCRSCAANVSAVVTSLIYLPPHAIWRSRGGLPCVRTEVVAVPLRALSCTPWIFPRGPPGWMPTGRESEALGAGWRSSPGRTPRGIGTEAYCSCMEDFYRQLDRRCTG